MLRRERSRDERALDGEGWKERQVDERALDGEGWKERQVCAQRAKRTCLVGAMSYAWIVKRAKTYQESASQSVTER